MAGGPVAVFQLVASRQVAVAAHQQAGEQRPGRRQQQAHAAVARPEVGRQQHQCRHRRIVCHLGDRQGGAGGHADQHHPPPDHRAHLQRLGYVPPPARNGGVADGIGAQAAAGQPGAEQVGRQPPGDLFRHRRRGLAAAGVAVNVHHGQIGPVGGAAVPYHQFLGAGRDRPTRRRGRGRLAGAQPWLDGIGPPWHRRPRRADVSGTVGTPCNAPSGRLLASAPHPVPCCGAAAPAVAARRRAPLPGRGGAVA